MNVRAVLCIFMCIAHVFFYAQQVKVELKNLYDNDVFFNPTFVLNAKIKTVHVSISDKPDNQIIENKGLTKVYEYNATGLPERQYYTLIISTIKRNVEIPAVYKKGRLIAPAYTQTHNTYVYDTISIHYRYDTLGKLTGKRTRYNESYNTWYYEYNEAGKITKQINAKETNANLSEWDFKLGVQTILSKEEFEYISLSPSQTKIKCLNDEGREYKTVIVNSDEKGRIINETHEFVVGGIRQEHKYEYDVAGRIIKKFYASNESGEYKTNEQQYVYDEKGNLITEIKIKNDKKTNEVSYLYDSTSQLLTSVLDRDFINLSIGIIKYSYDYY